jgi:uncharacterized protein YdcH (DUF465 family)
VQVLAEDDYGVSRVQVFRSLNDSRPRPVDAAVPPTQPRRLPVAVPLKLSEYGLKPGDVIKVFARVGGHRPGRGEGVREPDRHRPDHLPGRPEPDDDGPAGDGDAPVEVRAGPPAAGAARPRDPQAAGGLAKLPPDAEVSKEKQKELDALAEEVKRAADDIARSAGDDLPLDIDRKLRQSLYDLAADVRKAGDRFYHEAGQLGLSAAQANKAADALRKELGLEREQFEKEATEPLEHLAKIYPLKEDEARFADLAQRQRDLADRMRALGGTAGDDPKLKARLRDLEQEQRQLREELRDLLQDVDNHVQALPADPKLDELRKQAEDFAKAVRASEAAQQMNASETALSEFKGGDAAKQAKDAADTLERFLGQCKGMGDQAGECLKFQPSLSEKLGTRSSSCWRCRGSAAGRSRARGWAGPAAGTAPGGTR